MPFKSSPNVTVLVEGTTVTVLVEQLVTYGSPVVTLVPASGAMPFNSLDGQMWRTEFTGVTEGDYEVHVQCGNHEVIIEVHVGP